MAKNKKSQNIAINMIVWAALALIVLFVAIAIFSGMMGKSAKDLESCWLRGGGCSDTACGHDEAEIKNTKECKEGSKKPYCCVKVFGNREADTKKK